MPTKSYRTLAALAVALLAAWVLAACAGTGPSQPTAAPVPTAVPTAVTGDLWQQVQQNGKLVVGTSADYPPFEFYNRDFQLDGFDIALAKEIGTKLGVDVEFRDLAFDGLGGALEVGQIDAAISAISFTPQRAETVDFSNIYYVGTSAALAADSWQGGEITGTQQFAGLRVGVQGGSIYQSFAQNELVDKGVIPQANLNVYTDITQAIAALKAGRIQLVLLDLAPAESFAKQGGVKVAGQDLQEQNFAIAVPLGQVAFRRVLNRALSDLQAEGVIGRLAVRYLGVRPADLLPVPTPVPELPTPTPAPTPATATPAPTRAPTGCVDGMAWVADLTFDDRHMTAPPLVPPGQPFVKSWRVRNSGTCTWNSAYALAYDRGNVPAAEMGGQPVFVLGTVPPGATYDFSVNLVAPTTPGVYQGFWQMRNGQGTPFGETIYVGIRVPSPPPPTPGATATPVPGISFTANPTAIQEGQCSTVSWNTSNVQAVYYYQQGQDWQNNGVAGTGSRTECPQQTTTYYLRVVLRDGQVVTPSVTINVTPVPGAPDISQFSLNPQGPITPNQCVTLQWRVEGSVTQVQLMRNNATLVNGAPYQGSHQDCPTTTGQYTYVLQATGPGGTAQASQYLQVNAVPPTAVPPTNTPVPPPATNTPVVPATDTPKPPATDTPKPPATETPKPPATETPKPPATETPKPPATETPKPPPTDTPKPPPTETPKPPPTSTPVPPPPLAGSWTLHNLNGQPLAPSTHITANFNNGQLSGSGGCNNYNTTYTIDGDHIAINPPAAGKVICDEAVMQEEQAYFKALPSAVRFEVAGSNLSLFNSGSSVILQYAKGG